MLETKHIRRMANVLLLSVSMSISQLAIASAEQGIVTQLKQHLRGLNTFQANFSQQVTDINGEVLQQAQGRLSLQQPNKLNWELLPPNESILIADGETLWHIDPFVEQVVAIPQQDAIKNNPIILLTSPDSEQWQDFDVSRNDAGYIIASKADDTHIAQLVLLFDGKQLLSMSVVDRQQQTSRLDFSGIEQNVVLDAKQFEFILPDGYQLDDQRPAALTSPD